MKSPVSREFVSLVTVIYILLLIPFVIFFPSPPPLQFTEGPRSGYFENNQFVLHSYIRINQSSNDEYTDILLITISMAWQGTATVASPLDHTEITEYQLVLRNNSSNNELWAPVFQQGFWGFEFNSKNSSLPVPSWNIGDLIDVSLTFKLDWLNEPVTLNKLADVITQDLDI